MKSCVTMLQQYVTPDHECQPKVENSIQAVLTAEQPKADCQRRVSPECLVQIPPG